jgi:hypothetical protein
MSLVADVRRISIIYWLFRWAVEFQKHIDGEEYVVRRDDKREMRVTDDWALGTVQRPQFSITVILLFGQYGLPW